MTGGSCIGQADVAPALDGSTPRIDDEKFRLDHLQHIGQMRNSVDDINSQIIGLLTERAEIIRRIEGGLYDISTDQYFFGRDIDEITREWHKSRFHSKVVRDAVSVVRKTFMDDSKEASRSFMCTNITFGSSINGFTVCAKYADFEFMRNNDVFRICIPVLRRKGSLVNDLTRLRIVDQGPLSESRGLGDIGIILHDEILVSSLELDVVRRAVAELMDNYSETVTKFVIASAAKKCEYKVWEYNEYGRNPLRVGNAVYTPNDTLMNSMLLHGFI